MNEDRIRMDYAALADRLRYLLLLRFTLAGVALGLGIADPGQLGIAPAQMATMTAGYLVLALAMGAVGQRSARVSFATLTVMLLVDGLYLAAAMYATGGTQSPLRFLIYLHLVAVSLLASYRTGLKIALWDSLLLFVVLYAQAAALLPAVDVEAGGAVALDGMPALNVTAFWLFALATSLFSAMNERELRQRRGDLEALVRVGSRLDDEGDPVLQARIVLDTLVDRYGFPRGAILGASEDRLLVLAAHGVPEDARGPMRVDPIVERAWSDRTPIALRRTDPGREPELARLLPDARRVIVAPMCADGRPVGVVVLEHRGRGMAGVERRVMGVVAQLASIAALNLRNAVLLRRVRDLAERDSLTGAANRRSFQASLERVIEEGTGGSSRVAAVLFIDLDDFKIVNDTLGHAAGDELLVAVTHRISSIVRDGDMVARLGGDEFAVMTEDHPDLRRARSMAERLVRELRAPYQLGSHEVRISASIGIASAKDAVDGAVDMVRNADVAMYMVKAGGKAGFAVFDPGMHQAIRDRHELAMELKQAVELDQLQLRYQPIIDLASGRLAGVEALVRWSHPDKGLIQPGEFIEIAEEHGSILPIGRWVLREACRQTAAWVDAGVAPDDMFVGVNVSAREVQEPGFVDGVREALSDFGVAAARLVIEITETALLRATPTTISTLAGLRGIGVRVVIDDFGTGYFSLSHLRQFPVDALKIAGEFTQEGDGADTTRTSALSAAIVAMATSLGIETVAEGIETATQAQRMRALQCTYGQGFYFSRPMPPDEIPGVVQEIETTLADSAAAVAAAVAVAERTGARARSMARPGSKGRGMERTSRPRGPVSLSLGAVLADEPAPSGAIA